MRMCSLKNVLPVGGALVALFLVVSAAHAVDTVADWISAQNTEGANNYGITSPLAVGGTFQSKFQVYSPATQTANFYLSDFSLSEPLDYASELHMSGTVSFNTPVYSDYQFAFGWFNSSDIRHRIGIGISGAPSAQNGYFRADFGFAFTPGPNKFPGASLDGTQNTAGMNMDIPSGTYHFSFNYIPGDTGDLNYTLGPYHYDFGPAPQLLQDFSALDAFGILQRQTGVADPTTFTATFANVTYTGGTALPDGDANGDGIVNGQDLALISSNWLAPGLGSAGDVNADGIVNGQDLALIASNWLASAPAAAATVPEPSSIASLVAGAISIGIWSAGRRRRSAG